MGNKIKLAIIGITILAVPIVWSIAANAAAHLAVQSVTVVDKSTNVVAENPTVSGNTVASTIVFHELDDYVKYNLDLKNTTGTSFKILDITDDNSSELVEYSYDNHADEVIDTGESLNLELTITYIQQHLDDSDRTLNNNVTFTISYLDLHTGAIEEDDVVLVPNTGANAAGTVDGNFVPGIIIYVAVFAGVVFIVALIKKKKGIAVLSILAVVFAGGSFALNLGAVAEDYLGLNINLNSEIRLRDYFYGEIFWKDPITGEDAHITAEEFGADYYDADDIIYFGDYFDSSVPAPRNMEVVGFRFTGTDIDVDLEAPILDDWSVTLLYEEATYSIDYDYNGGTVATANPASIKASDASFTLVNPTKDTANFKCWTGTDVYGCEESVTVDPSQVYSDLSFTANYQHEIIVNDQNGTELDRTFVNEGSDGYYESVNYRTNEFKITGGSCTNGQQIITTNNSYEINNITSNTVCTITTAPIYHSVELTTINSSGSGSQNVIHGENAVFTNVVPTDEDYSIKENIPCTNNQTATYSNGQITVSGVKKDTVCTVTALPYMQNMTSEKVNSLVPNDGDTFTLYDKRDDEPYVVGRLADGRVWILENLRLDIVDTPLSVLVGNTNATETSLTYLKNGGGVVGDQYPINGAVNWSTNGTGSYSKPMIYTGYKDTVNDTVYSGKGGMLYNYCAASAGTYCYGDGMNSDSGVSTRLDQLQEDICPKGWYMPTGQFGGSDLDLNKLTAAYSENRGKVRKALNVTYTGYISEKGSLSGYREYGFIYSSSAAGSWKPQYLNIGDDRMGYYLLTAASGKSLRCILR